MLRPALTNPLLKRQATASIARALKRHGGNATHAAAELGISIRTMRRVLAETVGLKRLAERERGR
jgi:transcriptional regulator with PAS, ATPase and Fis domain